MKIIYGNCVLRHEYERDLAVNTTWAVVKIKPENFRPYVIWTHELWLYHIYICVVITQVSTINTRIGYTFKYEFWNNCHHYNKEWFFLTFLSLRVYQLHCRGYVDKKSIVSFNFVVEIPILPHFEFLKRSSYQIIDQSDNWSTNLFLSEIRLDNSKGKPHLKSWEEARVALGYASSTSYVSFVLSNFTLAS